MSWLVGPTLASFVAAFIVVKLFDWIFSGLTGSMASVARAGLFVSAWTAVTAKAGMRGFGQKVRQLRQGNQEAMKALSVRGHNKEEGKR